MILSGLSGYFDDAGKIHDQPSVAIGGFIGRKEQWERLCSDWDALLLRHEIKYFHGVDCEHGNNEFDKSKDRWKNPQARSNCRMDFVEAIINAGLTGFVSGLVSADYHALDKAALARIGKPFSLVAQTLVVTVKDWANACHVHELIPYLFEAGSECSVEFLKQFAGQWVRDRIAGVHPASIKLPPGMLGLCVGAGSLVTGVDLTFHLPHFARRAPTSATAFVSY
ncbi:MAG: hypothetical protein ABSH46_18915 [Bryobacteraceae bacterium]